MRGRCYLHSWQPPMTLSEQETAWWNSCLTLRQLLEPQLGSPQALACTSKAIVRAIWRFRSSRSASVMRVCVSSIFRACACTSRNHASVAEPTACMRAATLVAVSTYPERENNLSAGQSKELMARPGAQSGLRRSHHKLVVVAVGLLAVAAHVEVLADRAAEAGARLNLHLALVAGGGEGGRLRVVQVVQHHHAAVLGAAHAVELVVVALAERQELLRRSTQRSARQLHRKYLLTPSSSQKTPELAPSASHKYLLSSHNIRGEQQNCCRVARN